MKHHKHAKLAKPQGGQFHRNELAILGAPCGIIQKLAKKLNDHLNVSLAFVDADHGESENTPAFASVYTDKINHHQFQFSSGDYSHRFRSFFEGQEAVLVNGNHFKATQQMVIINEKKKDSLQKKLDRLTNVKAFILDEEFSEPFDFLKSHITNFSEIPVLDIGDIEGIAFVVKSAFNFSPNIKGLVLAGGKSLRMGKDKGAINYHGKPQREYMADMLSTFCQETFISTQRSDAFESDYPLVADTFLDLGPYGGILSAFRQDPNSAWLTVPCDVPLLGWDVLKKLIDERDPSKLATCFHNEETNFPEPLITLWEPRAYGTMLHFLAQGQSCPRKILINSDIKEVAIDQTVLKNVNTPQQYAQVKELLNA